MLGICKWNIMVISSPSGDGCASFDRLITEITMKDFQMANEQLPHDDNGQNPGVWGDFWKGQTPESQIRMWDFYGGRPWILKHTPRYGKVLEAGCGLGRYVFYLSCLGIDTEGLDFHAPTVEAVTTWGIEHGYSGSFRVGDVADLPYEDESLSGYLSFGVIEHFEQGPEKVLQEAYRVLQPGGIAVISTPAVSFSQMYFRLLRRSKDLVKRLIGRPIITSPFFQYWFTLHQLQNYVEGSGLHVVLAGQCDLKYAFWELKLPAQWQKAGFRVMDALENTVFARFGAQAFTIAVKVAEEMHCFLCDQKIVHPEQLKMHYLPICPSCSQSPQAHFYQVKRPPKFHSSWQYDPPIIIPKQSIPCHFCGKPVLADAIFEDFGFNIPICRGCLSIPENNLIASNEWIQPLWRCRQSLNIK